MVIPLSAMLLRLCERFRQRGIPLQALETPTLLFSHATRIASVYGATLSRRNISMSTLLSVLLYVGVWLFLFYYGGRRSQRRANTATPFINLSLTKYATGVSVVENLHRDNYASQSSILESGMLPIFFNNSIMPRVSPSRTALVAPHSSRSLVHYIRQNVLLE